ncbi:MAG: class E sortase [Thermoleophilaceae bacterium]|nr:class E sortase [Thermoleophilaceae bacterium]
MTGAIPRAAARFAGAVAATTGVLLLVNVAITLTWQEPLSAFLAARSQDGLERELAGAGRRAAAEDGLRTQARAARLRRSLEPGDAAGRIVMPSLGRSYVFVGGTTSSALREGPGHYPDTPLPGERGTVGIAGHRTTFGAPFRTIDDLDRGDMVRLEMPYGRFSYRVERTRIVKPTEVSVKRRVGFDRMILSACDPLYSAENRIVVFAKLVEAEREPLSRDSRNSNRAISSVSDTMRTAAQ